LIFHVKSSSFKRNCHPACPGLPWNRSEAKWRACPERSRRGPAVSFCPSNLTAPNKSHRPSLCHPDSDSCYVALDRAACAPFRKERRMKCINATNLNRNPGERTRISYFTALPAATYAALRKESRMKSTEATVFDRKSGAAERPAVRLSWTQLPHECRQIVGLRRHFDGTSNVPENRTRLNRAAAPSNRGVWCRHFAVPSTNSALADFLKPWHSEQWISIRSRKLWPLDCCLNGDRAG
jgi:hypothetical protein